MEDQGFFPAENPVMDQLDEICDAMGNIDTQVNAVSVNTSAEIISELVNRLLTYQWDILGVLIHAPVRSTNVKDFSAYLMKITEDYFYLASLYNLFKDIQGKSAERTGF